LNIWIINHFAYGPDQSAGTRHYEFAKALQEKGHDVLVIASSFYHKGRKEMRLGPKEMHRRENLYGVPFQWIRTPPYKNNPLVRLWNMGMFAWRVYNGRWMNNSDCPEVILGSSPSLLAALAGLLAARKLKIPFILEIRDVWPDSLKDIGGVSRWNPVYIFFKFIEKYLYKHSDHIITLLPNSFQHILSNGGKQDKITWIPNGVDLSNRPPLPRKKYCDPFTITYFGAHGPYSGLEILIDAVAILRDRTWQKESIRFLLIGEGPKKHLIERSEALGITEFFDFSDPIPKKDLWANINSSDAFLMIALPISAHKKGISPNKVWEYFAARKPVIFSIEWGDRMAQESGAGIAVTPGDAVSLADGIERLCAMDEKKLERLGENGRRYVAANADIPQLVNKLEDLIFQVKEK
jgi:glycosyltransferase involved in cell wall biosynthesis